jgi:hypothetical protein
VVSDLYFPTDQDRNPILSQEKTFTLVLSMQLTVLEHFVEDFGSEPFEKGEGWQPGDRKWLERIGSQAANTLHGIDRKPIALDLPHRHLPTLQQQSA